MEANSPARVDRFRQWIKSLASGVFSAPYLPIALTAVFIATLLTNLAIVLMSQPVSYWRDSGYALGLDTFGQPLSLDAGTLITVTVIYMLIAACLLVFMNYRWSLVIWIIAEFAHLYFIQQTLEACYISRWSAVFGELCQYMEYDIFFLLATFCIGVLLVFTFQPAEFSLENKKIQKGLSYALGVIPVLWVAAMLAGVALSLRQPTDGWIRVDVKNGPGPLREAESAYDTPRSRLVMFGGYEKYLGSDQWDYKTDTWEWDGNQWINMPSQETPMGRSDHALAYDQKRGVTVLFGGFRNSERLSDTWEWDGKIWKKMESYGDPSPRSGHEMIYDSAREKVVLYGGYGNEIFYNDAWEWDGEGWTKIKLESGAPEASVFALAYDPDQNYAFGFLSGAGGTWRWEGNTWTRIDPEVEPVNRGWSTLVYDPDRELFFLFGGISQDIKLSDTWTYNGKEWQEYVVDGIRPSARAEMVVWYDPIRKHVMLFGGYDDDAVRNDLWEFIPPAE